MRHNKGEAREQRVVEKNFLNINEISKPKTRENKEEKRARLASTEGVCETGSTKTGHWKLQPDTNSI